VREIAAREKVRRSGQALRQDGRGNGRHERRDKRQEFLTDLGAEESGLEQVIPQGLSTPSASSATSPLGVKEVRAWTIHNGDTAPQAAGVIHTDFERGFIRAEVIAYDAYCQHNGEAGAKAAGVMRVEGKEYVVKDGDVMHFRFNV
jgi:ribosome-binding ATPase YchF (GTP1/OBG family)